MTPFQERFGNYQGLFTYDADFIHPVELKASQDRIGNCFVLLYDDDTEVVSFKSPSAPDFDWENRAGHSKYWTYLRLEEVKPLVVSTKEELDLLCMLYPSEAEHLRDYNKDKL